MSIRTLMLSAVMFFICSIAPAYAASLYIETAEPEAQRGDTIAVKVRLDTEEGECVNVVDGVIHYSANIEPVDTSRGSSILSMWVEDPVIDKVNRTISFAGGIPNGYCGRIPGDPRLSNIIIELVFRSPAMIIGELSEADLATVSFDPATQVLLNDGFGTPAALVLYDASVTLLKSVGSIEDANEWTARVATDVEPPEKFSIHLERTPNAFSNKYYIVFNTTDKQSGIDHYEVIEEPLAEQHFFNWGAETAPWVVARSPYLLDDQSLNSTIRVRALDKAGNEYVAVLVPDEAVRSLSTENKILIALTGTALLAFIFGGVLVVWWQRRRVGLPDTADASSKGIDDTNA